ncbi:hypothetical protein HY620_03645 [Candidatus Uhrbacteria bacterium]|nr:hypothetical protein [Candidatus Uhrbacteria bacterium]
MEKIKKRQLPDSLRPLFWDSSWPHIDLNDNADYIITRVLQWGDESDFMWLKNHYTVDIIKESFKKSRTLDPRSRLFWSRFFGVQLPPFSKKTIWLQKRSKKRLR